MSLVINTNISSLNAQNNLTKSTNSLAQATERLSSGLQINSAADNAAGFAIATRFTTQIGGLSQASSNASDAISLAQTTGSALDQVTSNLQAIRDLAVQSANGTESSSDRLAINSEVQQRLAEITRIANQTDFNGTKVLDGSTGSLSFQVGANVGQTISVNLGSGTRSDQIGGIATTASSGLGALFTSTGSAAVAAGPIVLAAGSLSVGGVGVAAGSYATQAALAAAINTASAGSASVTAGGEISIAAGKAVAGTGLVALGLTAGANAGGETTTTVSATIAGAAAVVAGSAQSVTLAAGALTIDGTSITGTFSNLQDLSDSINAANIAGVSSAVNGAGSDLNLYSQTALTVAGTGATSGVLASGTTNVGGSLAGGNVTTVDAANDLVSRIDVALTSVSNLASNLGAVQNRFSSTISTLSAESDNLTSSRSTIQDTDFAAETANLSKSNVLQQAGISVLAQANSQPQQVLKLLQ